MPRLTHALALFPAIMMTACLSACGENSTPAATIGAAETVASMAEGRSLYMAHCMMCHQPQGEGVQGMQPSLVRTPVVEGDVEHLVKVTVLGVGDHAGAIEPTGQWRQQMQGFPDLSDHEVAAILTYIRNSWGNKAGAVGEDQVWDIRQSM